MKGLKWTDRGRMVGEAITVGIMLTGWFVIMFAVFPYCVPV